MEDGSVFRFPKADDAPPARYSPKPFEDSRCTEFTCSRSFEPFQSVSFAGGHIRGRCRFETNQELHQESSFPAGGDAGADEANSINNFARAAGSVTIAS